MKGGDDTMSSTTIHLRIGGMSCEHCVQRVQKALRGVDGVVDANVDLAAKSATVTADADMVTVDALIRAVEGVGYTAEA